jgi:hypothetical protein
VASNTIILPNNCVRGKITEVNLICERWKWCVIRYLKLTAYPFQRFVIKMYCTKCTLDNISCYWSACTKTEREYSYMCDRGIDFACFVDFNIWFLNCSDSVVIFFFFSIYLNTIIISTLSYFEPLSYFEHFHFEHYFILNRYFILNTILFWKTILFWTLSYFEPLFYFEHYPILNRYSIWALFILNTILFWTLSYF